ncbi:MAG: hypothetical protein GY813_09485 [Halieaceae bacterium]|nr:hypothetical protein [Halieaceae bacterium]
MKDTVQQRKALLRQGYTADQINEMVGYAPPPPPEEEVEAFGFAGNALYHAQNKFEAASEGFGGMAKDLLFGGEENVITDAADAVAEYVGPSEERDLRAAKRIENRYENRGAFGQFVGDTADLGAGEILIPLAAGAATVAAATLGAPVAVVTGISLLGAAVLGGLGVGASYDQGRDNIINDKKKQLAEATGRNVEDITEEEVGGLTDNEKMRVSGAASLGALNALPAFGALRAVSPATVNKIIAKQVFKRKGVTATIAPQVAKEGAIEVGQELALAVLTDEQLRRDIKGLPEKDILSIGSLITETYGRELAQSFLVGAGIGGSVTGITMPVAAAKKRRDVEVLSQLAKDRGVSLEQLEAAAESNPAAVGDMVQKVLKAQGQAQIAQGEYNQNPTEENAKVKETMDTKLGNALDSSLGALKLSGYKSGKQVKQERVQIETELRDSATEVFTQNEVQPQEGLDIEVLTRNADELLKAKAETAKRQDRLDNAVTEEQKTKRRQKLNDAVNAEADVRATVGREIEGKDGAEVRADFIAKRKTLAATQQQSAEFEEKIAKLTEVRLGGKSAEERLTIAKRIIQENDLAAPQKDLKRKQEIYEIERQLDTMELGPEYDKKLKKLDNLKSKRAGERPAVVMARRELQAQEVKQPVEEATGQVMPTLDAEATQEAAIPAASTATVDRQLADEGLEITPASREAMSSEGTLVERTAKARQVLGLPDITNVRQELFADAKKAEKGSEKHRFAIGNILEDVGIPMTDETYSAYTDGFYSNEQRLDNAYRAANPASTDTGPTISNKEWISLLDEIGEDSDIDRVEEMILERTARSGNEIGAAFDADGNLLSVGTNNDSNLVGVGDNKGDEVSLFTHTHPLMTPFSYADAALMSDGMDAMRAVLPDGQIIEMESTGNWDENIALDAMEQVFKVTEGLEGTAEEKGRIRQEALLQVLDDIDQISYTIPLENFTEAELKEIRNAVTQTQDTIYNGGKPDAGPSVETTSEERGQGSEDGVGTEAEGSTEAEGEVETEGNPVLVQFEREVELGELTEDDLLDNTEYQSAYQSREAVWDYWSQRPHIRKSQRVAAGFDLFRSANMPQPKDFGGIGADRDRVEDLIRPIIEKAEAAYALPNVKINNLKGLYQEVLKKNITMDDMINGLDRAVGIITSQGSEASTVVWQVALAMYPNAELDQASFVKEKGVNKKTGKKKMITKFDPEWRKRNNAAFQLLRAVGVDEGMAFEQKREMFVRRSTGQWDSTPLQFAITKEMQDYLQITPPPSNDFTLPMENPSDTTAIVRTPKSNVMPEAALEEASGSARVMQGNTYRLDHAKIEKMVADDFISDKRLGAFLLTRNDEGEIVTAIEGETEMNETQRRQLSTQRARAKSRMATFKLMAEKHGDRDIGFRYRIDNKGRISADGPYNPQTGDIIKKALINQDGENLGDLPTIDHSASGFQVAVLMTKDDVGAEYFNLGKDTALREDYKKQDVYNAMMDQLVLTIKQDAAQGVPQAQLIKERIFDRGIPFGKGQIKPSVIAVNYAANEAKFKQDFLKLYSAEMLDGDLTESQLAGKKGVWGYLAEEAYNELQSRAPKAIAFQKWAVGALTEIYDKVDGTQPAFSPSRLEFSVGIHGKLKGKKLVTAPAQMKAVDGESHSVEQTVDIELPELDAKASARSMYAQFIQAGDASMVHRGIKIFTENEGGFVTTNHDSYTIGKGKSGQAAAAARAAMQQVMEEVGDFPKRMRDEIIAQAEKYGVTLEKVDNPSLFNEDGSFRFGDYDWADVDTAVPTFLESADDAPPIYADVTGREIEGGPSVPEKVRAASGLDIEATFDRFDVDPDMRERSSLTQLYSGKKTPAFASNKESAEYLQSLTPEADRIVDFKKPMTPEQRFSIAKLMAAEAQAALDFRGKDSAADWYTSAVARAMDIASIKYPMMVDDAAAVEAGFANADDANFAFLYAMSVASQNLDVRANAIAAIKAFDKLLANIKKGSYDFGPDVGTGDKKPAMQANFDKFATLFNSDALANLSPADRVTSMRELFNQVMPLNQWKKEFKKYGVKSFDVGQTAADVEVYGSAFLGPKIGNGFYQNLKGNYKPITIDLWARRTWGRMTGKNIGMESAFEDQRSRLAQSSQRSFQQAGDKESKDNLNQALKAAKRRLANVKREQKRVNALTKDERKIEGKTKTDQIRRVTEANKEVGALQAEIADVVNLRVPEPWSNEYLKDNEAYFDYARRLKRAWDKEFKSLQGSGISEAALKAAQPTWAKAAKAIVSQQLTPLDQVNNGTQRKDIEATMREAIEILSNSGVDISPADLQAILWYPEKDLWSSLSSEQQVDENGDPIIAVSDLNESYDTVLADILEGEGYDVKAKTRNTSGRSRTRGAGPQLSDGGPEGSGGSGVDSQGAVPTEKGGRAAQGLDLALGRETYEGGWLNDAGVKEITLEQATQVAEEASRITGVPIGETINADGGWADPANPEGVSTEPSSITEVLSDDLNDLKKIAAVMGDMAGQHSVAAIQTEPDSGNATLVTVKTTEPAKVFKTLNAVDPDKYQGFSATEDSAMMLVFGEYDQALMDRTVDALVDGGLDAEIEIEPSNASFVGADTDATADAGQGYAASLGDVGVGRAAAKALIGDGRKAATEIFGISSRKDRIAALRAEANANRFGSGFNQYLDVVGSEPVSADDRPNLMMGDMYGMLPSDAEVVSEVGDVSIMRGGNGNVYAVAYNPDLQSDDVVGYVVDRGTGTELHVVSEMQGQGIGPELQYQYRKERPFAPTGGLTEGGKASLNRTYNRLIEEGVINEDDLNGQGRDADVSAQRAQEDGAPRRSGSYPEGNSRVARGIDEQLGLKEGVTDKQLVEEISALIDRAGRPSRGVLKSLRHDTRLFSYDKIMNAASKKDPDDYGPNFMEANAVFTHAFRAKMARLSADVRDPKGAKYLMDLGKEQLGEHQDKLIMGIERGTIEVDNIDRATKAYRVGPRKKVRQAAGLTNDPTFIDVGGAAGDFANAKAAYDATVATVKNPIQHTSRAMEVIEDKIFNAFAPIRRLEMKTRGKLGIGAESAYKSAENAINDSGRNEQLLFQGAAKLGQHGDLVPAEGTVGLRTIFSKAQEGVPSNQKGQALVDWMGYMVAKRAEGLKAKGFKVPITDSQIAEYKSKETPAFKEAADMWRAHNNANIDFLVDTKRITKAQAKGLKADAAFVPFYRSDSKLADGTNPDLDLSMLKKGGGGGGNIMSRDPNIKKMIGGDKKAIDNILMNMQKNSQAFVAAGMRNQAANLTFDLMIEAGVAKGVKGKPSKKPSENAVAVWRDGKKEWVVLKDQSAVPLLVAMAGLEPVQLRGIASVMATIGSVFRQGITLTPAFMIRNGIRGAVAAGILTGGSNLGWTHNTLTGFRDSYRNSAATQAFKSSSGMGDYKFGGADLGLGRNDILAEFGIGKKSAGYRIRKFMEGAEKIGTATELADRLAVYNNLIAKGVRADEAAYQARALMDYQRKGSSPALRAWLPLVPFLNAKLQGLSRMAEGGMNSQGEGFGRISRRQAMGQLGLHGLVLSVISGALWALNASDEEKREKYKAEPLHRRLTYHIVYAGDRTLLIPKAFELGHIFSTIPELFADAMVNDMNEVGEGVTKIVKDTVMFNMIPAAVLPMIEAYQNKSFFTQRDIEGMRESNLRARDRVTGSSSLAQFIGRTLGVSDTFKISPVMIEHVLGSYGGAYWKTLASGMDVVAGEMGIGSAPVGGAFGDVPVVSSTMQRMFSSMLKMSEQDTNKYMQDFYENKQYIKQIYSSAREAAKSGDIEYAKNLLAENPSTAAAYKMMNKAETGLRELNREIRMIRADTKLTPKQKSTRIGPLIAARNKLVRGVNEVIVKLERAQGKTFAKGS